MRQILFPILIVVVALFDFAPALAEEVVELPSYMLMLDETVSRDADASAIVSYAYSPAAMSKELEGFDVEYPDNINFPQGSLLVMVVTDHTDQAFSRVSALRSKRRIIIELRADGEAGRPNETDEGAKASRLLVIGCPAIRGVKQWAIRTADGKQQIIEGKEVQEETGSTEDAG